MCKNAREVVCETVAIERRREVAMRSFLAGLPRLQNPRLHKEVERVDCGVFGLGGHLFAIMLNLAKSEANLKSIEKIRAT